MLNLIKIAQHTVLFCESYDNPGTMSFFSFFSFSLAYFANMNICYSIKFETEDSSFFILEALVYTWCTCDICLFSAVIRGCHWSDMLFNTATNLIRNWTQELLVTILEIYQHNYCYLPISNVLLYFSLILKRDALPTLHPNSTHAAETSTDDLIPSTVSALRSTPSVGFMNCRILP